MQHTATSRSAPLVAQGLIHGALALVAALERVGVSRWHSSLELIERAAPSSLELVEPSS